MDGPVCCDRVSVGGGCCRWADQSNMIGWVLWRGVGGG